MGRVWTTTPFTSEVELITNDGAAAGAMLEDSRLQGVIQGDGSDILRWNFIPNYESVEVETLFTPRGRIGCTPRATPLGKWSSPRRDWPFIGIFGSDPLWIIFDSKRSWWLYRSNHPGRKGRERESSHG